ncbi:MAG: Peptidyl-tRNA hydrolase ArfB [Phycisphaerae bacterium]|nr:Peptidyl-tRNA hydrolase ArfB [Phycisphaerae bacterium]
MLQVTASISIDEGELGEQFIRSSGPGGQNVNKVATAVQLRFDAARSPSLTPAVRERLLRLAGSRATADGLVLIEARRHRHREQNRADARERLADLIRRAATPPRPRHKTRPSRASQERRLERKKQRSQRKRTRAAKPDDMDR